MDSNKWAHVSKCKRIVGLQKAYMISESISWSAFLNKEKIVGLDKAVGMR